VSTIDYSLLRKCVTNYKYYYVSHCRREDCRGIERNNGGMNLLRRKEDAIRYGIKPNQQVIGISIKRQGEMQEVLLLHRKRRCKELVSELESTEGKKNVYRVAKQMANSRQDVV